MECGLGLDWKGMAHLGREVQFQCCEDQASGKEEWLEASRSPGWGLAAWGCAMRGVSPLLQ